MPHLSERSEDPDNFEDREDGSEETTGARPYCCDYGGPFADIDHERIQAQRAVTRGEGVRAQFARRKEVVHFFRTGQRDPPPRTPPTDEETSGRASGPLPEMIDLGGGLSLTPAA